MQSFQYVCTCNLSVHWFKQPMFPRTGITSSRVNNRALAVWLEVIQLHHTFVSRASLFVRLGACGLIQRMSWCLQWFPQFSSWTTISFWLRVKCFDIFCMDYITLIWWFPVYHWAPPACQRYLLHIKVKRRVMFARNITAGQQLQLFTKNVSVCLKT